MGKEHVSLVNMKPGQTGVVSTVNGGPQRRGKLHSLGITEGMQIMKVSSQWLKGPVTVRCRGTEVALGYGIARDLIVSIGKEGEK